MHVPISRISLETSFVSAPSSELYHGILCTITWYAAPYLICFVNFECKFPVCRKTFQIPTASILIQQNDYNLLNNNLKMTPLLKIKRPYVSLRRC